MAAQEENPLLDASVLDNAIQTFLSRICPTFVELSISQLRMVPFKTFLLTSFSSLNHSSFWPWMHRERVSCSDCYLTFSPLAGMSSAGLRAFDRRCYDQMPDRGHRCSSCRDIKPDSRVPFLNMASSPSFSESIERGRRQGTDTGENCSRGHEMRGAGGGRKGGRVERKEATSRQERERGAGEEAKGRGAIEGR